MKSRSYCGFEFVPYLLGFHDGGCLVVGSCNDVFKFWSLKVEAE
jgi:hypothetical protein